MSTTEQRAQHNRTYYKRGGKAKVLVAKRTAQERNLALVRTMKARPCTDCGNTYHFAAMQFDHVRGHKVRSVSEMAWAAVSIEKLQIEIDKCEVVCANCHALRTYSRMGC